MTIVAIAAGSSVSVPVPAGSQLRLSGQGRYRIGPQGTSARPTVDELLDEFASIGPYEQACTVIVWADRASTYDVVSPSDITTPSGLTVPGAPLSALASGDEIAAPVTNLSAAVGAAGALTGAYYYTVTFVTTTGETAPWPGTASVVNLSSQRVNLTGIPTGPAGVIARRIYRTPATPVDPKDYRFLVEISDNTTTTYTDNIADGSLGDPVDWNASNRGRFRDPSGLTFAEFSDQSTALGQGAFATKTGYASTAVGFEALKANTTGRRNTAVGTYSLTSVTTGFQNTGIGVHAGQSLTTQRSNTFAGFSAGFFAGSGSGTAQFNVAVGDGAMYGTTGVGIGSNNVAIGYQALLWGAAASPLDNCIGIGAFAGQFANNNRQLYIDTQATVRATAAAAQNEGLIFAEIPTSANVQTQRINLNGSVRLGSSTTPTVANLPAAAAGLQGCRRYVTDASVAYTSANVGTTVAGGGANCVPVFCTGTAWVIG